MESPFCWLLNVPCQGLSVKPTLVYFVPAFPQSMCSAAAKCPSWCALKKFRLQTPLLPISFSSADCFPWSCWSWLWNLKGLSGKEWNHRYTQPIVPPVGRFWLPARFVHPNWLQGLSKLRGSGWLHSPGILQSQDPQYTVAGLRIFGCENHSQLLSLCSGSCCMAAESIKVQRMNCPGSATKPGWTGGLGAPELFVSGEWQWMEQACASAWHEVAP